MPKKSKNDWQQKEWQDMPEYVQESKAAIKRVVINFENEEDMEEFNKVTGLKVTMKTKGVFYPIKPSRKLEYIDES